MLLIVTGLTLSIAEEYSDTFVLSAVKNTIESEASMMALQTPGCENTAMKQMTFSEDTGTISFSMNGCPLDVLKIAGAVETAICGAKEESGTATFSCGGAVYTLVEV